MLVVVEGVLMLELLEPAVLVVVELVNMQMTLAAPELLVIVALLTWVVVGAVVLVILEQAAQAAQASSSLNTTHPYNPSSHSKALPSG